MLGEWCHTRRAYNLCASAVRRGGRSGLRPVGEISGVSENPTLTTAPLPALPFTKYCGCLLLSAGRGAIRDSGIFTDFTYFSDWAPSVCQVTGRLNPVCDG